MKVYLAFKVFDLRFIKGLRKMDDLKIIDGELYYRSSNGDLEKVDIDRTKACVSCDRIYIKKFSCDRFYPMKSDKIKKQYEDYKINYPEAFC